MNIGSMAAAVVLAFVMAGCADIPQLGSGPKYGDTTGTVVGQTGRNGTITSVEIVQVDQHYKLGVGTAVGAVAGGLLGAQIGEGTGSTVGAVVGAAAGTVVESKMKKQDAQRVTVKMTTGGSITIVQPVDSRLRNGMAVRIEGSGETARVVPR